MSQHVEPLSLNIDISDDEMRSGVLSADKVRLGSMLLHMRGYVILRNALPLPLVDELRSSFDDIFNGDVSIHAAGKVNSFREDGESVYWEMGSRFRVFPRLKGPFASPYVLRNPFADRIISETLGDDYYCKFVSSDTAVKGSRLQAPHRDIRFYDARRTFGSIVNIPIMHCGLHNGPTEVWPGGSHLWRSGKFTQYGLQPFVQDGLNPEVEELAAHMTSTKIELFPGELLIRDPGMWHRGTPNVSDEPRTMLTSGYFRRSFFYKYGDPFFNLDAESYAELDPDLQRLFEPFFDRTSPLYWKLKHAHAFKRATDRPVAGAPLRAGISMAQMAKRRAKALRSGRNV